MRNRCKAIVLLIMIVIVCVIMLDNSLLKKEKLTLLWNSDTMQLELFLPVNEEVCGWEKDGVIHYFIPSYVHTDLIELKDEALELRVNGMEATSIPYDVLCEITLFTDKNILLENEKVCFHHSQNLYTMYIGIDEFDVDEINKDEFFTASIKVVTPSGQIEYQGEEDNIKGRGNSTWRADKKPYSIKLKNKSPLCNLNPSRSWSLLTNSFEGTKIASKVMYDFANDIGMEYKVDTEWVDLYINGEYRGNYLLCEKIEIDENRLDIGDLQKSNERIFNKESCEQYDDGKMKGYVTSQNPDNITGGYILEKDVSGYYASELCGFVTDRGDCFTITSPNNASIDEVEYIQKFVQTIDNCIVNGNQEYANYIDEESFIKRYFLEELAFNSDTYATSCYFYKKAGEDILYAGPIWDYDGTFGDSNGSYLAYDESVLHQQEFINPSEVLDWDIRLHKNPEYFEKMKITYTNIYPKILELLNHKIDCCADKIRVSVALDSIRWDYGEMKAGHYSTYDNNIRYMKFFLKQRINLLNEKFGINQKFVEESIGDMHKFICVYEDQVFEYEVKDGDFFKEANLPPYDNDKYSGWCYQRDQLFFCEYLPIFEDVILIPNKRG